METIEQTRSRLVASLWRSFWAEHTQQLYYIDVAMHRRVRVFQFWARAFWHLPPMCAESERYSIAWCAIAQPKTLCANSSLFLIGRFCFKILDVLELSKEDYVMKVFCFVGGWMLNFWPVWCHSSQFLKFAYTAQCLEKMVNGWQFFCWAAIFFLIFLANIIFRRTALVFQVAKLALFK